MEKWLKTPVKEIISENNNINGYLSKMFNLTVTAENDDQEPIAPECYYACEDFMVFEDLTVAGFKMLDRMVGLNLEQCLLVMRTMAKLLVASAVLLQRNPKALEVYKDHMFQEPEFQESFANMMKGLTRSLIEELETWDEEWQKYIPKLNYLVSNFMPMLVDTCTRRESDFNVLTHGDLWVYNLMFRDTPFSIRLVDFQLSAEISAAIDLNYFLYTSPNRDAVYGLYSIIGPYAVMQNDPKSGFSFEEIIITTKAPGPKMYGEEFKKNIRVSFPSIINKHNVYCRANVPNIDYSVTMTTPWLQKENLEKWLKTPVKHIESENNDANGFLSSMIKMKVTAEDGRIFPLLVKCRLYTGNTSEKLGTSAIYRKEMDYYTNVTHAIREILKEAYPDDPEFIDPECYYASEDFVVFEDLTASGFKMLDKNAGLNLEQCLLVMRTLGKFHAASAALLERKPRFLYVFDIHMFQEHQFQETNTIMLQKWHKYIPKIKYLGTNFIPLLEKNCSRYDYDFNVLNHGDLWISNLMFREKPTSIRFVDFQLASIRSAAIDLTYFFCTSTNTEALKYKNIPSLEDIHQMIDRKTIHSLYSLIGPYVMMQSGPDSGFSFEEFIVEPKNPGSRLYGEEYKKNIRGVPKIKQIKAIDSLGTIVLLFFGTKSVTMVMPWLEKDNLQKWLKQPVLDIESEDSNVNGYLSKMVKLRDLIDPGFRMPDRMAGLNLEQCLLVMRTLGKFHAASAVLIERKPQDLEVYQNHMFQDPRIQESFGNLLQEELETWEEEWHKYVPKLKYLASNFIPLLENTCKRSDSDFNVLIHGDAWTYNILFRDEPFSIRLVDYQLAAHTSAAIDLIYFLCTSPKRDVRAINIQRLIQESIDILSGSYEYHNTLSTTLKALKYKNIPSLRDITQDIGKKSLYALFCLSCPYAVLQCDPESGFSFDECIVNPKAPGPKMYGEEYRKNLRMMLPIENIMAEPWFDKDKLQKWLKTPIKYIELGDGYAKGENYLSTMKRVLVTSEDGRKFPLIFKCRLLNGTVAQLFGKVGIFQNEFELYENIIPAIRNLLKEAFPDDDERITADCYYASDDLIVLENLTDFEMRNRKVGLNLEECLLVMRTLAKFHASSAVLHERNPRVFDKVNISFLEQPCVEYPLQKFITGFALTMAEEIKTWDEEWHKYIPKLERLAKTSVYSVRKVYERNDTEFNALIHGDLWTNNILIRGACAEIRIVDFQLMSFNSAVLELHYFIGTTPTLEVRAKHMENLIEEYHKTLFRTLTALKFKKHIPTLQELQEEFDKKALYGVYSLIPAFGVIQCDSEVGFSFDELYYTGKTPGTKMYSEYYKEIVKLVLPELDKKGAFYKPWFDKEKLQKWLKTPVKDVELGGGLAKGDNYLSAMKRVLVTSEDGRKFPLIFKCRLLDGKMAEVFGEAGIFQNEYELYKNITPALRNLLKEAFPDEKELISADCYYACDDFLVLENLLDFEMKNRRVGLDLQQCLLVIRTLAKFHVASAVLHERNPRVFDKVDKGYFEKPSLQVPMENLIRGMSLTMAEEMKTWDEEWHKYIPKLELLAQTSKYSVRKVYARNDSEFNSLVHGDLWTNNILIRGGSAEVRFVDFQQISFSSPVLDLHYFLATTPNLEVRVKHLEQLIEELQEEYDKKALYGVYSLIAAYGVIQCDPEIGFSFDDAVDTGKTPGTKMYSEYYKEIVKVVLPVLDRKRAFDIFVDRNQVVYINKYIKSKILENYIFSCLVSHFLEFASNHCFVMATPWLEKENMEEWLKTPVREIVSTDSEAKGDNYLSTIRRLTVNTEDGRMFSLLVKCRVLTGLRGEFFVKTDVFRKEVEFYGTTIHAIREILSKTFPDDTELIAPECYYACEDFLVLEDLTASGFKMCDRWIGIDVQPSLLVMRTLAKIHAASVVLYEKNSLVYKKFDVNIYTEPVLQHFLRNDPVKTIQNATNRNETDFNVLIHADLWTNNLLFKSYVEEIRLVDYQFTYFSNPVLDIIFYVSTSPTTDVRANHIPTLVQASVYQYILLSNFTLCHIIH
ncbi:hypothetical protein C0J52_09363 [Blattella germanica]|nr:hypothetical protein C0J52_09363 [Blattella germanica]